MKEKPVFCHPVCAPTLPPGLLQGNCGRRAGTAASTGQGQPGPSLPGSGALARQVQALGAPTPEGPEPHSSDAVPELAAPASPGSRVETRAQALRDQKREGVPSARPRSNLPAAQAPRV